jgi:long-chain acyl-CoA synthetase
MSVFLGQSHTLLTPTLKLKRNNLAAHFAKEIDLIYQH